MMVVLGIIGLVVAMSLPMLIPFLKGRKLERGAEMVKTSCILARSKAVKERKRISVTFLEQERRIIINDYDQLRYMLPIVETGQAADNSSSSTPDVEIKRASSTTARDGHYVTMTGGIGFGQQRLVTASSSNTLTLQDAWTPRPGWDFPAAGDEYVIGGKDPSSNQPCKYLSPHFLDNFPGDATRTPPLSSAEQRDSILSLMAVLRPRELPEGCRFDLDADGSDPNTPEPHAWTYIFQPTGGVFSLGPEAKNSKDNIQWRETTWQGNGAFCGPRLYGADDEFLTIIAYAMTGQVVTE